MISFFGIFIGGKNKKLIWTMITNCNNNLKHINTEMTELS